ncbi:serine/threonine-protein phosphatase 7 long form homolog [Nicotiana tomentosiformis]|uniref:serine/threonine-protein phosphatase 7 long form homolog n=1 Tax=Nicotiana tomentosiformis TaxID=4098 RepID=UPI00388CA5EF
MWGFLKDRALHPRIVRRPQDTGFNRIVEIGRLQLDWSLITALIERWRPETHTFHLPIGEATITLQDMEVMYGLPVDGHHVALPHAMREQTGLQYLDMLQWLTGLQPPEETALVGASRLQLTAVRQHSEALHPDITDDTPELHIHRYTMLLLLAMFGGVLFPSTSGNLVSLRFLHHPEQLDDLPQYSWGAAVLGYLYRQMCLANMGTQRDVAGFLPLLQVWARERFLQLQPPLPPLAPGAPPPFLPLARRLLAISVPPVGTADATAYQRESNCFARVIAGQTTPSTEPASPTDDHPAAHPPIKRQRDEDDPDSVAWRDGMRLRPTAALKHTGCWTH